jgi:hypothetical protein
MPCDTKVAAAASEKSTRDWEWKYDLKYAGKKYEVVTRSHDEIVRTMKAVK